MACGTVGGKVCPSYKTLIGTHVNFIGNLLKKKIVIKKDLNTFTHSSVVQHIVIIFEINEKI